MAKRTKQPRIIEIFVSPEGRDSWTGRRADANRGGTDGPLRTLVAAQRAVRRLKKRGRLPGPVRVVLRGGRYELRRPLVFTPRDSGMPAVVHQWRVEAEEAPVTYAAYPGETPVISGGRRIKRWRRDEIDGREVWVASLPAVKSGKWAFRQLFVNGQRRLRPRLPREGEFHVEKLIDPGDDAKPWVGGNHRFVYGEGDLRTWRNLQDVEILAMHVWYSSRMNIASLDEKRRVVNLDRGSQGRLIGSHLSALQAAYYVENVFEAIRPGEWYLDRPAGKLYYMPLAGEDADTAEVIAPALDELMVLDGDAETGAFIEALHFEGLSFEHNRWRRPPVVAGKRRKGHSKPKAVGGYGQAAVQVPGAVQAKGLRFCSFERCRFANLGTYALELVGGCRDVLIGGNEFADLGAGGVKVWHVAGRGDDPRTAEPPYVHGCRRIRVTDNHIHHCGLDELSAVGILVGRCSGNEISHNHIHHLYYTGISVGWTWGYGDENNAYGNVIEHNLVHDIGQGKLSDMGGIYTLGQARGTRIRLNVFHHVISRDYGGWGIYPDEGSSELLIEHNLVYRCKSASFHQHFGRNNLVRNNIFALGRLGQMQITRGEPHMTVVFRGNIIYFDGGDVISGNEPPGFMQNDYSPRNVTFERNLYFDASRKRPKFLKMPFSKWRALGFDAGSRIADPKFVNPAKDDFRLRPDSPAFKLGFQPFDLSAVGPRPQYAR